MPLSLTQRRLPYVLGLVLAAFLLLFSFDVFGTPEPLWRELVGFVIHSLPTILILIGLGVARTRPRWGGWLFLALAVVSLLVFNNPVGRLITSLPMALIGALFLWQVQPGHITSPDTTAG